MTAEQYENYDGWMEHLNDDAAAEAEVTFRIVRYRFKGENETIETGLTLEEAQEWCNRPDTRGDGWFDGYRQEDDDESDDSE